MKKVLLITYYWPPAGGPGVQRWLKFAKYLPDFGINPIIYTPKNPSYPIIDTTLEREIPSNLRVIKKSIIEPYSIAQLVSAKDTKTISSGIIADKAKQNKIQELLLYVRGNYFIPDARKLWVSPSVKYLTKLINEENISTIITTGPPHSMHLIGNELKKVFPDRKWLADFRDPWTTIGYHNKLKLTDKSAEKHQQLEKEVLDKADQIVVTSFTTKTEFEAKTRTPVQTITNGFDGEAPTEISLDEAFSIAHIGSLLSDRNPEVLWKVLAELVDENPDFKNFFELHLVGKVSEQVLESIESFGLKEYAKVEGYVSHQKAIELQQQSQVLLLLEINAEETKAIIPGKVFEYMHANRPILAIGPKDWDVEKLVNDTQTGVCFSYNDELQLKKQIQSYFEDFLKGKLESQTKDISAYSRKRLTEKLASLLLTE
ncbi:MAG: glycosyltransferase [Bacteroidota bacterium]